jgi:hypothetical protein
LASVAHAFAPSGALRVEFDARVCISPHAYEKDRGDANQTLKPREDSYKVTIYLEPDAVTVEQRNERTRYGIRERVVLTFNLANKTYTRRSLYSDLAFRVFGASAAMTPAWAALDLAFRLFEFQNERFRAFLDGVAAGIQPAQILAEHAFSIRLDDTPAHLTRREEGGEATFLADAGILLVHSVDVEPAEPADVVRFVQALRYAFGGHPEILRQLVKLPGIPRKLVIHRQEPRDDTSTELVLKSLSRDVRTPTLEGFALQSSTKNERLTRLARKVDESTDAEIESHLKYNIKLLKKATADKDILTVYFLHTEIGLQRHIDEPLIDISALGPLIRANADIAEFAQASQARTKEQRAATIKSLERIRSKRPERAHFLTILEANKRVALGELDVAEELYLDGLEGNPFLTGAWVDLGDLYFKKLQMATAWRCWEVARRIDSAHPVLKSLNDLEKRLQADFPDYFKMAP